MVSVARTRKIEQALDAVARMQAVAVAAETSAAISARPTPEVLQAIALLRVAGYRVSKPMTRRRRSGKQKDRVGPTYICEFADGVAVSMTVSTPHERPDAERGRRMARQAWATRCRLPLSVTSAELVDICPAIIRENFETGGAVAAIAAASSQ